MTRANDSFRKKRAEKITSLVGPLSKEFSSIDLTPLTNAAKKCYNPPKKMGDNYWKEEVLKLNLGTLNNLSNVRPKEANLNSIDLEFNFIGFGKCEDDSQKIDPFIHAELTINIKGKDMEDNNLISSWHFDRHISESGDNEPLSPHPQYHFQHGGRSIQNLDDNDKYDFGSSLYLESPRLFHPPLNLILSLNFLIAQFYSQKWKRLKVDKDYRRIVNEEQKRYWRPYFSKLSSYLEDPKFNKEAEKLMPILIR